MKNIALILLIIALAVLGYFLYTSGKEKGALNTEIKYQDKIDKQKSDTISYYKILIGEKNSLITERNETIKANKNRIAAISEKLANVSHDSSYLIIQQALPEKTDTNSYPFSGNQVHQLHEDNLELLECRSLVIEYETLTEDLTLTISYQDKIITSLETINAANAELVKEIKKQTRRKNIWKIATPIAFIVGVLI